VRIWILAFLPLLTLGAQKGDVSLDQAVDALDVLLLERAVKGEIALGSEAAEAGDVAPLGPTLGDGWLDPADLAVLLRIVSGEDVDGDGLPAAFENLAGTLPFAEDSDGNGVTDDLEDSDGDGLTNAAEYAAGLHPGNIDSDGDGVPDGFEGAEEPEAGVATNLEQAVSFLYEGPAPLQAGVAPGTIEPLRVAVLRGRVLNGSGVGVAGVTISVKDHPELGETITRFDGGFDLAVNGGSSLTLDYSASGLLPVQRQADVPWRDWVVLPDVVMVPVDATYTDVTMDHATWQVASASAVTDDDGTRQARVLFPPNTIGTYIMPGGATPPSPRGAPTPTARRANSRR
jgi:hypothetical protein